MSAISSVDVLFCKTSLFSWFSSNPIVIQVKKWFTFRSYEAAAAADLLTLFARSDIPIQHLLLCLIWHWMSQSIEFSLLRFLNKCTIFKTTSSLHNFSSFIVKLFCVRQFYLKILPQKWCKIVKQFCRNVAPYLKREWTRIRSRAGKLTCLVDFVCFLCNKIFQSFS